MKIRIRRFYKYYCTETDKIYWLNIEPDFDFSGLIYQDEYTDMEEEIEEIKPFDYREYINQVLYG